MKPGKATMRSALLIIPAFALAMPAFAQVRPTTLSDPQEPGSVIVFPKFIQNATFLPEGPLVPVTELEIGVVCPKGVICAEHQPVKLRFHWVCGTNEADLAGSFVCKETDFDITATVFEKIVLTPNGETAGTYTAGLPSKFSPAANCPNAAGYLIGWVISPTNDKPIKFDGLIGDAQIRNGVGVLASYNAIPIQTDPALASGAAVSTNGNGALVFDGAPGHYQAVTGQVLGDIRYTNSTTGPTFTTGILTLLTLDVKSNRPNNPVFVDLDFFGGNPSTIGNENQLSTSTEFTCWEEIQINAIDPGLTTVNMGRQGVFVSAPAMKVRIHGIMDDVGPTTLLGLSEYFEFGLFANTTRLSFTNLFNSSVPVPTHFLPTPSPNFLP